MRADDFGKKLDESTPRPNDRQLMAMVWRFVVPHRRFLLLSVLLLPLITAAQQLQPYLFKLAIDGPIARQVGSGLPIVTENILGLLRLTGFFLGTLVFSFGLEYLLTYLMELAGQRVVYDMRMSMFRHLQRLNLAFYERNAAGRLMTRITNDLEGISEFFSAGLISLVADLFKLTGILIAMCLLSFKLTLFSFTVAPLLLFLAMYFRVKLRRTYLNIRKGMARINVYLAECLSGVETVKLFNRAGYNDQEFKALNRSYMKANLRAIFFDSNLYSIIELISTSAIAIFIYASAMSIDKGLITLGTIVAFVEYIKRFFIPIRDIGMKYSIIQSAFASADRIHQLLSEDDFIPQADKPIVVQKLHGEIAFCNVTFGYKPNEPVLKDVSFSLKPGEILAIVGATGSGKSTILKLINRFYDVWEGQILIDGVDLRQYDTKSLRRHIGQVLQDVVLFSGTVADNIKLDLDLPPERLEAVARQAQADRFIDHLSQGYQTLIQERGANISHGQRQLLAFARVLAKDPKIFLFDEATSNIDSHTEMLIQQALTHVLHNRTSLIVAHRLSTVTIADRIVVMHKGEIAETGDHQALLAQKGLYARLYQLQFNQKNAKLR
ncbi:MAG: ABC transporter ATP-binding protein [FCB group bacterium]|nr:ABC transporter ATP-binding protein [FCB group bacterium]